jgi:putative GTP pyrophosphokinase
LDDIVHKAFLKAYNVSNEVFEKCGMEWSVLQAIARHHIDASPELNTTASYITERLRAIPAVHSLKVRIKQPEHLIEKIIRKKANGSAKGIDVTSYQECVTDLIGIRALHLFKDEWKQIHEFVKRTWNLRETPIAYYRQGDPDEFVDAFKSEDCDVKVHPLGYRSVHYLIESQAAKQVQIAELQVRTIFEEGWSEIDHRVRYPRASEDPYLAALLAIFNRLAGSADEMGTFTKRLSVMVCEQKEQEAANQKLLDDKEKQLQETVSKLQISNEEKVSLAEQITKLRPPLGGWGSVGSDVGRHNLSSYILSSDAPSAAYLRDFAKYSAAMIAPVNISSVIGGKTCQSCKHHYFSAGPDSAIFGTKRCPNCGAAEVS